MLDDGTDKSELRIAQTKTAYLTLDGDAFTLSLDGGAQAAFFDTVEVYN